MGIALVFAQRKGVSLCQTVCSVCLKGPICKKVRNTDALGSLVVSLDQI